MCCRLDLYTAIFRAKSLFRWTWAWVLPLTYPEQVVGLVSVVAACFTLCWSHGMHAAMVWKGHEELCKLRAPLEELSICSSSNSAIMALSAMRRHFFHGGRKHWTMCCNYSPNDTSSETQQILSIPCRSGEVHRVLKNKQIVNHNKQKNNWNNMCIFWASCHF